MLQQHLPFTVLKQFHSVLYFSISSSVATALTVYGIETLLFGVFLGLRALSVATALTVYGIETLVVESEWDDNLIPLQQHLPFTVLKLTKIFSYKINI